MALFCHPISVSAAVLSTLAVIASPALAQRPPAQGHFLGDRCEGYNGVEGTCLPPIPCPALQQVVYLLPLPEIIKRHGPPCDYDLEGNKLLCCPKNSTEPDCEYDGSVYQHGEDDGCYYKCYNGTMKMMKFNPSRGNPCVGPFEIFEDNCYYFNHTEVTWCEARKICVDHGGDLPTGNYYTLKDFFVANNQGSVAWVGVRDNLWLNGQEPLPDQSYTGQPDARNLCGMIWVDAPCYHTWPFICQLY